MWNVNWPAGMTLSGTVLSDDVGNAIYLASGFEIHILYVSSNVVLLSELRVKASRELNNTVVQCPGTMTYTSTIQIASVGEMLVKNRSSRNLSLFCVPFCREGPPAAPSGVMTSVEESQSTQSLQPPSLSLGLPAVGLTTTPSW